MLAVVSKKNIVRITLSGYVDSFQETSFEKTLMYFGIYISDLKDLIVNLMRRVWVSSYELISGQLAHGSWIEEQKEEEEEEK